MVFTLYVIRKTIIPERRAKESNWIRIRRRMMVLGDGGDVRHYTRAIYQGAMIFALSSFCVQYRNDSN